MGRLSRGLLAALFLFVITTAQISAQQPAMGDLRWLLVRVSPDNDSVVRILHGLGFEQIERTGGDVRVAATRSELASIREAGLDAEVLDEDLGRTIAERNTSDAVLAAAGDFAYGSMGGYFSPDEIVAYVDSLRATDSDSLIGDTLVIGESLQGRPVWLVEMGGRGVDNPPEVFFNSLIHAREGMSMMSVLYFMRFLKDHYATSDSVRWLVDNRRIVFVPLINPDGYEINWKQYDSGSGFGLWRKNARDNDGDDKLNYPEDGVDLNRNFGYEWGHDNIGSSNQMNQQDFRGDSAFSEPETRLMRSLVSGREFQVAINCHSYGNYLLKPWSYNNELTPDDDIFEQVGSQLVKSNGYVHSNATGTVSYPANGEFTDWEYGDSAGGKVIAWTAEIGPSRYSIVDGFWPSADRIEGIAQSALPVFFGAARAAGFWPRIEVADWGQVKESPRMALVTYGLFNLGLEQAEEPYTVTFDTRGTGARVIRSVYSTNQGDSLVIEFPPEVYSIDVDIIVEQNGLTITSTPITLTRETRDISGDLDASGRTDVFDLLTMLTVLKHGVPQDDNAGRYDLNGDGGIDIFDIIDMLKRLKNPR